MRYVSLIALLAAPVAAQDDADLIAKARAIHERVLTLDTHKDISPLLAKSPPKEEKARQRFREMNDPSFRGSQQADFPKMREGGLDCAFFIVYVGQSRLDPAGFHNAKKAAFAKFDAIDRMCRKFPDDIGLARTAADVERIRKSGRLVACIGIENGYPMGEDPSLVEEFWKRGARYMSITHNRHNQLGDSHTPKEPLHGGLTDLGRRAIEKMNELGIMVDVSHASKKTMLDALAHSKAPVIASHSGAHAICAHGRNLDDEQLLALKKNGGVIQCVAFRSYVRDYAGRQAAVRALRAAKDLSPEQRRERMKAIDAKHPPSTVKDFVDHIDYAVRKIGVDHVGIASDFDGGGGVDGWNDASETFNVTLEMVRRGYTEPQIAKIWALNTLRVWREVEEVAKKLR